MDTNIDLPAANATDPSDVVLALETAHALWRNGDSKDALKWLRRAAETAEAEGDDMRALSLARAAAELSDLFPMQPSTPPAASASGVPAAMAFAQAEEPPPAPHPPTMPASGAPVSTPVAAFSAAGSNSSPSASSRPVASHPMRSLEPAPTPISSLATASRPPPLPMDPPPLEDAMPPAAAAFEAAAAANPPARPFDAPLPPSFAAPGEPPSAPPSGFGSPHAAPISPALGSPLKKPTASAPIAAPPAVEAPAPMVAPAVAESPDLAASARQTLRVAVEVLSRGSGTFLVRILDEGEAPPSRGYEALLVPLIPGVDLREG